MMMQDDDGGLVGAIAKAMHVAYEVAAAKNGWETQESCRVPFDYLPSANKAAMYASASAALSAIEREGWKVVPVEPTDDMIIAGAATVAYHAYDTDNAAATWNYMLSAAPKQG